MTSSEVDKKKIPWVPILIIAVLAVAFFVARSVAKTELAGFIWAPTYQKIATGMLPEADKQPILAKLREIKADFDAGKLSNEQLARLEKVLSRDSRAILELGPLVGLRDNLVRPSTLENKAEIERVLERFARVCFEGKIKGRKVPLLFRSIVTTKRSGQKGLKSKVPVKVLLALVEDLRQVAAAQQVPDEPFAFNIHSEVIQRLEAAR